MRRGVQDPGLDVAIGTFGPRPQPTVTRSFSISQAGSKAAMSPGRDWKHIVEGQADIRLGLAARKE